MKMKLLKKEEIKNTGQLTQADLMKQSAGESPYEIPLVSVDRNRWFIATIVIACLFALLLFDYFRLRQDRSDVDVAWVKIYPNASYEVQFDELQNKPEFFNSTIDSLVGKFVEYRYKKDPNTIRSDYGIVLNFMSAVMQRDFISAEEEGGYGAAKVASDVIDCGNQCETLDIDIGTIEHYEKARIGDNQGFYRTNVYITEKFKVAGSVSREIKSIVALQWRVQSKGQIIGKFAGTNLSNNMLKYLRINPLGLEILEVKKYEDPTNNR